MCISMIGKGLVLRRSVRSMIFFFLNDTASTEIYTLSLHDALPISGFERDRSGARFDLVGDRLKATFVSPQGPAATRRWPSGDRKSTRLNSSHMSISYAVFCLKKKKKKTTSSSSNERTKTSTHDVVK